MDNQRLILSMGLAFVVLLIWQQWHADYGPKPTGDSVAQVDSPASLPTEPATTSKNDVPNGQVANADSAPSASIPSHALPSSERIQVTTDVYDVSIDTTGGDLREVDLRAYPVSIDEPDHPFRILDDSPGRTYIAQTGLIGGDAPNHYAVYKAAQASYRMAPGEDELRVPLTWKDGDRVVTKTYVFHRGSYDIRVEYQVTNGSGSTWNVREYRQLQRSRPESKTSAYYIHTFTGAAIWSPEDKYEKISFDDMDEKNLAKNVTGGWIAMSEHYFVSAWVPPTDKAQGFYTKALGDGRYVVGMMSGPHDVPAGGSVKFGDTLYIGPKIKSDLDALAPGLHLTIDYGWVTVISEPLFWLLSKIHGLFGNWGIAIIILTMMIKAAFYKLSEASYRSMANMRKLSPRLQALKEKFGDDKQKMNQAMMEMYRKEKINPLGGCLPMLVQIPVFIALYWAILESVELRQAPFFLWIHDLSTKDPYFVLPVIMGISMLVQQRLNPAPPDPMQAKIMMALPFVFTAMFAFFPSGLVLYWVVNNILSIAQQWHITRKIEAGEKV